LFEISSDEALEGEGVGRDIVSGGGIDEFSDVDEFEEGVKIDLGSGGIGELIAGEFIGVAGDADAELDDVGVPEELGYGCGEDVEEPFGALDVDELDDQGDGLTADLDQGGRPGLACAMVGDPFHVKRH
jgi:hypothetical protein